MPKSRSSKSTSNMDKTACGDVPHVLVFPFPAHSHVNTMLNLAEILCLAGIGVTFLNSDYIQARLDESEGARARFARYRMFRFEKVTDGLPDDHPHCGERVGEMFHSTRTVTQPAFREMMLSGRLGSVSGVPVTCVIADGVMSFSVDIAKEIGVPCILFRTVSAACFWAYFSIPRLIESGVIPFKRKINR